MDLNRYDSLWLNTWIGFFVVDCLDTVEPQLDVIALGSNAIVVPLPERFDRLFERLSIWFSEYFIPATLIVEGSIKART